MTHQEEIRKNLESLRETIRKMTHVPVFLIVEDDKLDAEHLTGEVKSFFSKCEILNCDTGECALEFIASRKIDAVFLDLRLPKMDGLEVMRQIKAGNRSVLVIVTGLEQDSDATLEAIRLGAVKVIAKPVTQEDLQKTFGGL